MRRFVVLVMLAVVLAMYSCTAVRYVPVAEVRTDTVRTTAVRCDSVYVHDSVAVAGIGDTVFVTKYRYVYRDRVLRDTVFRSVRDSISVPVCADRQSGMGALLSYRVPFVLFVVAVVFLFWIRRRI